MKVVGPPSKSAGKLRGDRDDVDNSTMKPFLTRAPGDIVLSLCQHGNPICVPLTWYRDLYFLLLAKEEILDAAGHILYGTVCEDH